jgi:hypothetical protein
MLEKVKIKINDCNTIPSFTLNCCINLQDCWYVLHIFQLFETKNLNSFVIDRILKIYKTNSRKISCPPKLTQNFVLDINFNIFSRKNSINLGLF